MSLKLRRYCECHILYNYRVWVVETIWTKLAAPHTVIETSLRNSSQELNFLLRRLGGETSPFGSIAGAETALTREFGRPLRSLCGSSRILALTYPRRGYHLLLSRGIGD